MNAKQARNRYFEDWAMALEEELEDRITEFTGNDAAGLKVWAREVLEERMPRLDDKTLIGEFFSDCYLDLIECIDYDALAKTVGI